MNQFANIGSMFPGANHKHTRDKAKEMLSSHPSFEITGLVITNQATKKKHYIDQGIHGELDHNDVKSRMDELEEMFSLMLIAEVKRHGGIPKLSEEEMKFRDTLSEFLMTKAHWSQIPEIMAYNQPGVIKQGPTVKEVMDEVEQAKKGGNNG